MKTIRVTELAKKWMKDPKFRAEYNALEEEFSSLAASKHERTRLSEPHPLIHHQSKSKRKKTAR